MTNPSRHRTGPGGWAIAAGILAAVAIVVLHGPMGPRWFRVVLSLAPSVPLGLYCFRALRGIHELDELQTRIQLEAGLLAFFATLWGLVVMGLLAAGGLLPDWPLTAVWPWLWLGWSVLWVGSGWLAGRRYR
jgi:hypothetical protein